jgi:SulP family sulfate permease
MRFPRLLSEMLPWSPRGSGEIDFRTELLAGVAGATLVIPQGITFAYLAGLPPEYGLYTAIFVTLFASLFGSTSMLGGPNTAVAILIGVAVLPYAGRGSPLYIEYVLLLSLIIGLIQLLVWLGRGGKYFQYLSPAAIMGITTGVGVILVLSSVTTILGVADIETRFFFEKIYVLAAGWRELINPYSLAVGFVTVATGLAVKRYAPRYAILIAIAGGYLVGLLIMGLFSQVDTELDLLGHIPFRILPLSHPRLGWEYLLVGISMFPNAVIIALIGLAQSMVIVKDLQAGSDQPIDIDKEVFAQGIANTLAPFFSSFAGSGSFNRTSLNQSLDSRTPLAGILSAGVVLVLVLLLGDPLAYMPMAVIGGTLMLVGIGMIKPKEIARLFSWRGELWVFMLTLLTILFLGLQTGLIVAIAFSILMFVLSASKLDITIQEADAAIRIRAEGHLFYASIDQLSDLLKRYRDDSVILDLSVVSYMDLSATDAIARDLQKRDRSRTSFVVVLKSQKLIEHFERRQNEMPVEVIRSAPSRSRS